MAASHTMNRADVFPVGTTVGVYARSDWHPTVAPEGAPPGSTVTTAAVGASGAVTFSGLTEGVSYVAGAQVGGVWRYISFLATSALGSGGEQQFGAFTDGQFAKWDAASGKFVGGAAGLTSPVTVDPLVFNGLASFGKGLKITAVDPATNYALTIAGVARGTHDVQAVDGAVKIGYAGPSSEPGVYWNGGACIYLRGDGAIVARNAGGTETVLRAG